MMTMPHLRTINLTPLLGFPGQAVVTRGMMHCNVPTP